MSDEVKNDPCSLVHRENQELTKRSENLVRRGLQALSKKEYRSVIFQGDRAIGKLFIVESAGTDFWWKNEWQEIGEARGTVMIPKNKMLILRVWPREESFLNFYNDSVVADLSSLSQLNPTDLQGVDMSSSGISSILPLKELTELQYLDASETSICSLAPLDSLSKLRVLKLSCTEILDTEYLEGLSELVELDLSSTAINEIGYLKNLHQLRQLDLEDTPQCEGEISALQQALPNCKINF